MFGRVLSLPKSFRRHFNSVPFLCLASTPTSSLSSAATLDLLDDVEKGTGDVDGMYVVWRV